MILEKLKNKKVLVTFIIIAIVLLISGFVYYKTNMTGKVINNMESKKVILETTEGKITIELYNDMPITTGNFEKLVSQGFYNGVIFHRVIDKFMIQGGDPTGTGMGGPGYNIKDEFTHKPKNSNDKYTISMANAGPNTGGSQFFINLVNNNFLDTKHPAFGKVIEGMDIVDKIGKTQTDENDRPIKEIKIIKATVA
ncbi:Cyclophilin type peptidyl-prolyl cis-trans isomerase/CLD [uncultured archaeon]|nr:Cyclophilin type peptidyl-prolyl cis-trans isomerase/CLD [uncultured archaeon]